MPTSTERLILARRRAELSGDILVPILETLLERECIPEDEEDFQFMDALVRERATPRRKGVFSPSMLGSCTRQAYFAKRRVEKHEIANSTTNGYFLTGNFTHFKWQFALHKAHRAGLLELIGCEIRVFTKDGNFGGTIDAIVRINGIYYVVDFKGINLIDFQKTVRKGAPPKYRKQIVGYAMIANEQLQLNIEHCLLISESKSGPVAKSSPLALHETLVDVEKHTSEVTRRLRTLRWHDHKNEMPKPECVSTTHMQYMECPFSRFCKDEVVDIQRAREERARSKPVDFKVNRVRQ